MTRTGGGRGFGAPERRSAGAPERRSAGAPERRSARPPTPVDTVVDTADTEETLEPITR